jgi:hypothetical protein
METLIMTTFNLNVLSASVADSIVDWHKADAKAADVEQTASSKLDVLCDKLIEAYPENTLLYLISNNSKDSLASPELYADLLTVCATRLKKNILALMAIDPDTLAPSLGKDSKGKSIPNPERVAVMDARKQPQSILKDVRNSVAGRLKARDFDALDEDEKLEAIEVSNIVKFQEQWATMGKRADKTMTESELASVADSWRQISMVISAMDWKKS